MPGPNAGSNANAGSLHVQMQSRFIRLYPEQAPNVEASLPLLSCGGAANGGAGGARMGPFELVRKGGLMLAEGAEQLRVPGAEGARARRRSAWRSRCWTARRWTGSRRGWGADRGGGACAGTKAS